MPVAKFCFQFAVFSLIRLVRHRGLFTSKLDIYEYKRVAYRKEPAKSLCR